MAIKKATETEHGLVADYWVLANFVVNPTKLVALGTYALWGSEAAWKADRPPVTTTTCNTVVEATDDVRAIESKLQQVIMAGQLSGGEVIPI